MRKFLLFVLTVVAIFSAPVLYAKDATYNCKYQKHNDLNKDVYSLVKNNCDVENELCYLYCGKVGNDGCQKNTVVRGDRLFVRCNIADGAKVGTWEDVDISAISDCGGSVSVTDYTYYDNFDSYEGYVIYYGPEKSRIIKNKCKIRKNELIQNCTNSGGIWQEGGFKCDCGGGEHENNRDTFPCKRKSVTISKISGTVKYNDKPAKDVEVKIDIRGTTAKTNRQGYFEFINIQDIIAPVPLTLIAKYNNHSVNKTIQISATDKKEYKVNFEIKTPKPQKISGKIYGESDKPFKKQVTIAYFEEENNKTTSVLNGKFNITADEGSTITFSAEGYEISTCKVDNNNNCSKITMSESSNAGTETQTTLSGTVKAGDKGLADVTVTISTDTDARATTNANGKFTLTNAKVKIGKDATVLNFKKEGYKDNQYKLNLTENNIKTPLSIEDVTMEQGTTGANTETEFTTQISGTVKAGDKGLADVTVTISTDTDARATTNANGKFTLTNAKVKIGKDATVLNFKKEGYKDNQYKLNLTENNIKTPLSIEDVTMEQGKKEGVEEETEVVQPEPDPEKIKKAEEAEAKYKAAAEKEKAGRAHSAIATGLSTAGGYMLGEAIAERRADRAAEADMKNYLAGMRCSYAGGQNVELGQTVEIPGGDELFNNYNKYKQIAERLKRTKAALNLPAGIESQVVYDKAETNLYKYTTLGARSGGEISLARALTDPNSEDAAAWAAQKEKTNTNMTIGGGLATSGLATGIIGRIAVNNKYDDDDDESEE